MEEKKIDQVEAPEVKAATDAAEVKDNKKERHPSNRFRNKQPRRAEIKKEFDERVIKISRVTKVVKGGKRMRFSALVVIGDKKGRFGYGLGKSNEVPDAIKKAVSSANKDVKKVVLVKGVNTITHTIVGKFGATSVYLKPAPEGTGLVAGGAVRSILELAGVKNIYSKIYGSRTQSNVVKATIDALSKLKTYEQIQLVRKGIQVKAGESQPVKEN